MDKERYWKSIEQHDDRPWSEHEAEELRSILSAEVVQRALRLSLMPLNQESNKLLGMNLYDSQQQYEAAQIQGRVRGALTLVESLMDLATAEDEEQSNG